MHKSSFEIMKRFAEKYLSAKSGCRILDLGSQEVDGGGGGSYRQLFERDNWLYEGADVVPGKNVSIVLNSPYRWKGIRSKTYDCVACGQMLEHDEFFWLTMLEIRRVLKPGGVCCIVAPSMGMEHRYPVDCYRYYPDGMKAAARYAGLEVLEAYAQWNPELYPDMNSMWRDCVLIARRPDAGVLKDLSAALSRWLIQKGSRTACETRYGNEYSEQTTWTFPVPEAYCALYWDYGEGFSGKNVARFPIRAGKIQIEEKIPDGVKAIRFDPVEGYRCAVKNVLARINGKRVKCTARNGKELSEGSALFFETADPQMMLDITVEKNGILEISGLAYVVR